MLSFLSVQMCLLSSVEFLSLAWRNDAMSCDVISVSCFEVGFCESNYVSEVLLSFRVTVA